MSNLDPRPAAVSLQPGVAHAVDVLEARKVTLPASEGFDYGCSPRTARPVPAARRSPALPRASSRECSRIFR